MSHKYGGPKNSNGRSHGVKQKEQLQGVFHTSYEARTEKYNLISLGYKATYRKSYASCCGEEYIVVTDGQITSVTGILEGN